MCSCIREHHSFYDGTDATRQENDHYIYYNAAMVAIPNECPTTIALKNASPTKKGVQNVCEPTSGSILARVSHV